MPVPFDVRDADQPGVSLASIDRSGNLTVAGALAVAGALTVAGQTITPAVTTANGYYPPSGYGLVSLSVDPVDATGDSTFTDGTFFVSRMFVPAATPVATVGVGVSVAATGGAAANGNGVVIYEDDGTLAGSQSVPNLWNSGAGWKFADLGTPVAAQSAARWVRVGILVGGWTGVRLWFANRTTGAEAIISGGRTSTHRRTVFASGVTAFPASITPASYGTLTAFLPVIGLA